MLVQMPNPGRRLPSDQSLWAHNIAAPLGTRPRLPASGQPPFRMDVPCYTQPVPDLNGPAAAPSARPTPKAVP